MKRRNFISITIAGLGASIVSNKGKSIRVGKTIKWPTNNEQLKAEAMISGLLQFHASLPLYLKKRILFEGFEPDKTGHTEGQFYARGDIGETVWHEGVMRRFPHLT